MPKLYSSQSQPFTDPTHRLTALRTLKLPSDDGNPPGQAIVISGESTLAYGGHAAPIGEKGGTEGESILLQK